MRAGTFHDAGGRPFGAFSRTPAVVPKQARARGPNRIPLGLLKFTNMTSHDATPLAMLPSTGKMLPQTGTSCEGGLGMTAVLLADAFAFPGTLENF